MVVDQKTALSDNHRTQTKFVPTFWLSSYLWDSAYFCTSQALTFPYSVCTLKLPVCNCHKPTKLIWKIHFLVNFILFMRGNVDPYPVYTVAFAHLNFQMYFTLLEVKWVLSVMCAPCSLLSRVIEAKIQQ